MNSMPIVDGIRVDGRDFPTYTWNTDLIYFDGPLLSLYRRDSNGQDALFFWIDNDDWKNRWGVVEINRESLRNYLTGKISLRDVVLNTEYLYVFDVGLKRTNIKKINTLPDVYLPTKQSFLYPEISTHEAKALIEEGVFRYELLLSGDDLYVDDLAVIPKLYQQLYSFHYGLGYLNRIAVRDKIFSAVQNWTGGFSSVHLFNGLKSVIPSIHRARVSNLQYASPGHIGMELLPDMAKEISRVVSSLDGGGFEKMESAYSDCYRYFKDERISGFEERDERRVDNLSQIQIRDIREFVDFFVKNLQMASIGKAFERMEVDVLGQLRAILAYYRRLRQLYSYIQRGTLKIPRVEAMSPSAKW